MRIEFVRIARDMQRFALVCHPLNDRNVGFGIFQLLASKPTNALLALPFSGAAVTIALIMASPSASSATPIILLAPALG
jgi:hypothetical protein